jgi:hypothetical protein
MQVFCGAPSFFDRLCQQGKRIPSMKDFPRSVSKVCFSETHRYLALLADSDARHPSSELAVYQFDKDFRSLNTAVPSQSLANIAAGLLSFSICDADKTLYGVFDDGVVRSFHIPSKNWNPRCVHLPAYDRVEMTPDGTALLALKRTDGVLHVETFMLPELKLVPTPCDVTPPSSDLDVGMYTSPAYTLSFITPYQMHGVYVTAVAEAVHDQPALQLSVWTQRLMVTTSKRNFQMHQVNPAQSVPAEADRSGKPTWSKLDYLRLQYAKFCVQSCIHPVKVVPKAIEVSE